jgi:hypothetical protein
MNAEVAAESTDSNGANLAEAKPVCRVADLALAALWLAAIPLLYFLIVDLFARTDVRYLVLLPLLSFALLVPITRPGSAASFVRCCWALGGFVAAGILVVLAAIISSPWLALLAIVVGTAAWMTLRLASIPWHRPIWALVPLAVLLVLPMSDVSDWTGTLERQVAKSSGILLDMVGVPHLVDAGQINLRFEAPLEAALACRSFGNPYVLFCAAAVLLMFASRSLSSALLALASVPLWSWLLSTVHLTLAAWLWEQKDVVIFAGPTRNLLCQFGFLTLGLGCVFLTRIVVSNLLAPLANVSSDASWTHSIFNRLAMWPNLDEEMLEEKRHSKGDESERRQRSIDVRVALVSLAACALGSTVAGVIAVRSFNVSQRKLATFELNTTQEKLKTLQVPEQIGGLSRVGTMSAQLSNAKYADQLIVGWTYANTQQRVEIQLRTPQRGAVSLEGRYLNQVRRESEPRSTILQYRDSLGAMLVSDVMLLDELYGRSYLCYLNLTPTGEPPLQTIAFGERLSSKSLRNSLTLQPTVYTVSLFIEGTQRLSEEERMGYHETLIEFTESLSDQLR